MRSLWRAIRPAVFWSYRRGSWQYDIMVGLILAFIFLTPRGWFRDQPRHQQIVMLPTLNGQDQFWIDPELIGDTPPERLESHIRGLLEKRMGRRVMLIKTEPARDSEGNLKGYVVHARH